MKTFNNIYVDGEWIASIKSGDLEVVNPTTEEVIATVPRGGVEDVDRAAKAAARALEAWSATTLDERASVFTKLARLVEARAEEITDLIVTEVGQARSTAKISQVVGGVEELDLMAGHIYDIEWEVQYGTTTVHRVPVGVVGAITAWNAPLRSVISKACAAMAAGCTVVVKGSEVAPLSVFLFAELMDEAGVPAGVFNLVSGTGPEVGEAIVNHPVVDMVSLTGSVRAGSRVMELAAAGVKRVHLELGGKSANVILPGADLQKAISVGLDDAFRNAGQVCGGLTRILVHKDQFDDATQAAVAVAEKFVIGDPSDAATTLGPVKNAAQQSRIRMMIQGGIDEGAQLLTGGADLPDGPDTGYFVRPTVFAANNSMSIARDEVFGPVVVVIPFDDEQDAIDIANDSPFGLAGAVWAADDEHARAVASKIRTGRVRINGAALDKHAPHGGFKRSGIGREWGRYGIEEFLEFQSVFG